MSDGRHFTSYVDSDVVNQYIRHANKIKTSNDFRQYLQANGASIINKEREFNVKKNTCGVNGKCNVAVANANQTQVCRGSCNCHQKN